jgi:hypothetical protein
MKVSKPHWIVFRKIAFPSLVKRTPSVEINWFVALKSG